MKIYVDFQNQEVYTSKEYENQIQEYVDCGLNDIANYYCDSFEEWLNDNYTPFEIFDLDEESRANLIPEYRARAEQSIRDNWECEEFNIKED